MCSDVLRLERLKRGRPWCFGGIVLLAAGVLLSSESPNRSGPPLAKRDSVVDNFYGTKIADPYRWLEDQSSPQTRNWIDAENEYTHAVLDRVPGRQALRARLTALMKVDVTGLPIERRGRYFFMRRRADQDLFVIYMRQGLHGSDQVLIDPHPMSRDHSTSVVLLDASKDGTRMVYGVRQGGQDELTVHFFDVDRRRDLPYQLPKARYDAVVLLPDNSGLYYSVQKSYGPRVYYHAMGTPAARDKEVFGAGYGRTDFIDAEITENGRYLVMTVGHGSAADVTEVYFQDVLAHGPITPIVKDIPARFLPTLGSDHLFLETDWKAPNERVFTVSFRNPAREYWREIIPEGKDAINSVSAAGGRLFVGYLHNVSSRLSVFDPNGHHLEDVPLPAIGSISEVSGQWDSRGAFFGFSSFVVPQTIYRYDVALAKPAVWSKVNVPINSDKFEVQQVWYTSKDGTRVPMFLVYPKHLKRNCENPTLMTGYGGFDLSMTPYFSAEAAAWVESGGVFALPSLRGGGEFGEKWHHAGMLGNKQNVFDDFIAAAEWLIDNKYTKPGKLAITGVSNGGLLVGAALTQRPDLFRAVVCGYPLLDMLRYQNFLVARFWVPEYGSAANPSQFKYLLKYSPYQNVRKGVKYPAVLLVSGDGDTRVAPLHARKMAAMLQWATASDRPVLLDYDTHSGHSGGRPLGKQIGELMDEMSFLSSQLNLQR
jgi:prolyl oligopeptidase